MGVWLAYGQQSPGNAVADLSEQQTLTGYLTVDPYPVLHNVGPQSRSVMLVEQTKKSANELAQPYANQWVTLSGFPMQRGDWSMLQLRAGAEIKSAAPVAGYKLTSVELGEATFEGEIIDSKCFLGAMKPGGGKVHRACAALCLLGGIPPMLVVKDQQGDRFGYLLMNADGSSASIDLSGQVAVPVKITGQLMQRGDVQYIRLVPGVIQKLAGKSLIDYGETLAANKISTLAQHHNH